MITYGLVMAGGDGKRFWPLSRQAIPKQFLNLTGKDILINETINRISNFISHNHIYVVANKKQKDILNNVITTKFSKENIFFEPVAKNTAICICYSAFKIMKKYGDGVMCVFPADHYIKDELEFSNVLKVAIDVAINSDKLVTIGIKPTFASTGYGYIKLDLESSSNCFGKTYYNIEKFIEKPDITKANEFSCSASYLWNSGVFVWKVSEILNKFKKLIPVVFERMEYFSKYIGTDIENEKLDEVYMSIPSISIDYGIMEHSTDIVVIPGSFGWNDIGSWDSLESIYPNDAYGNISIGENIIMDSQNTTVYSSEKLVVTLGIENLVIVESGDVILVCSKNYTQDIKKIIDELGHLRKNQFL